MGDLGYGKEVTYMLRDLGTGSTCEVRTRPRRHAKESEINFVFDLERSSLIGHLSAFSFSETSCLYPKEQRPNLG